MVGPVILEVLVKHYFDRLKKDAEGEGSGTSLKDDDVLYHEAFTIVKVCRLRVRKLPSSDPHINASRF